MTKEIKTTKERVLNKLVEEFQKNKNIKSIIQIGSSLYDAKSKDIDLILVIEGETPSYHDMKFISKIKRKLSKQFGVVFGKAGFVEKIETFNIDLIIIPESYRLFYSFNPLLIYGMSLNPYKVLYGYDFFQRIKGKLKANKEMLFKFGGPFANFYFFFILNFDDLTPKNSMIVLSYLKIILYPLVFMKGKHTEKKNLIRFLRVNYEFFDKLCKKYEIKDDIVYRQKLSYKEIEKVYNFLDELIKNLFHLKINSPC